MENQKKYTLITGAGSGLGKSMAEECAKRGFNLLLVSLPGENLKGTTEWLAQKYKVDAVFFETDLTIPEAPRQLFELIDGKYAVNMLLNNAGIGGTKAFDKGPEHYIDKIIMLNVRAVALLTKLFLPELQKHANARVLNIASIAAFSPLPYKTVYPASKAFVYSFSRGLNEELKGTTVKVCVAVPGPIVTNQDILARMEKSGFFAKFSALMPDEAARQILAGMLKGQKVIIPGFLTKINIAIMRSVPAWIKLGLASRMLKKELV